MSEQTFSLQAITEKDPLIAKLKAALEKGSGQSVPYITIEPIKRMAGVSARSIIFGLENGQQVTFLIRNTGDIFRVLLNGRDLPMATDFDHASTDEIEDGNLLGKGMAEIGQAVRKNQKAFDDKQTKGKITIPKAEPNNKVKTINQRLKEAEAHQAALNDTKTQALAETERLTTALAQAKAQTTTE